MNYLKQLRNSNFQLNLFFEAVSEIDDVTAYGASVNFNGLFQIDLETGISKYIGMFPGERSDLERLFFSACRRGDNIYFFPNAARFIHRFNCVTKEIKAISYDDPKNMVYNRGMKFGDSFIYNSNIYVIGAFCPRILLIDEDDNISYIDIPNQRPFLFRKGVCVGDSYYAVSLNSNLLMELSLSDNSVKMHLLPNDFEGAWNVTAMNGKLWFLPRKKKAIVRYINLENGKLVEIEIPMLEQYMTEKNNYLYSYAVGKNLYGIPEEANCFLNIQDELRVCAKVETSFEAPNNELIGFAFATQKFIYLIRTPKGIRQREQNGTEYYKIDKNVNKGRRMNFVFDDGREQFISDMHEKFKQYMESNVIREQSDSLELMLDCIINI